MRKRVVIKFGGADLSTGEKIAQAAQMVKDAPYEEKLVVVSAMGKMTESLIGAISKLGNVCDADYAEIVSMGERTSARILSCALRAIGENSEVIDPTSGNWPIITDSDFRDAKPEIEETKTSVKQNLEPMLASSVPVVCGFLGKDTAGKITTLGRGGSDTTAMLLAYCLQADEIVLVKDTSGILSADPKVVSNARFLNTIDIQEAFDLMQGGAKIIKPEALKYKLPSQKLRIVSFDSGNLTVGGTEIQGSFNMSSTEIEIQLDLLAVNMVCEVNANNLKEAFQALQDRPVYGVSSGKKSITIFTSDGKVNETINKLHSVTAFKAISFRENVAMIQVTHPIFVDSPGGVARISTALSQQDINIIETTTSKATINVFIEANQLRKAKEAISHVFET